MGGAPGSTPPTPLVPAVTFDRLLRSDAWLGGEYVELLLWRYEAEPRGKENNRDGKTLSYRSLLFLNCSVLYLIQMLTCKVRRIFLKDVVVCCRCINPDANENVKGPTWLCTQFKALFDSPKSYNYYISHRAQLFKTHRSGNGRLSHGHPPRGLSCH